MLDAATCEAALKLAVADAPPAEGYTEEEGLSEDAAFATFDGVQDYVDLYVIVIVACAAPAGLIESQV